MNNFAIISISMMVALGTVYLVGVWLEYREEKKEEQKREQQESQNSD